MNQNDNGFITVLKQSLIVLAAAAVVTCISLPLYYLVSLSNIFEWSTLKFSLGAVYGMILGVGNFFAMAISLVMLTATAEDGKQGRAKAQSTYMLRQLILFGLAIAGCLIPIFHPVAVLVSLALTQLTIAAYALIGKALLAKSAPTTSGGPSDKETSASCPDRDETSENDTEGAEK